MNPRLPLLMTEPTNPADIPNEQLIASIRNLSKILAFNVFESNSLYNALYVRYTTELIKREGMFEE